jgi:prephenate dehydrogenase
MNTSFSFNRVTVLGVGLIGASFALALRERGLCGSVCGYGRKEENLVRARQRGIIDDYRLDAAQACADADLVLLSTPVGLFKTLAGEIRNALKKGAIVTDIGSIKGLLVHELEALMPEGVRYIGCHPIAGSDRSGIDEARADLFRGARCIITPTAKSDTEALQIISTIWKTLGAKTENMDAARHDEIYAAVSHLPHIVAYALVNTVGTSVSEQIEYAGPGFRDTTRIAMSSPELWRDVSLLNRENLLRLIDLLQDNLGIIKEHLEKCDAAGIEEQFSRAQALRKKLT